MIGGQTYVPPTLPLHDSPAVRALYSGIDAPEVPRYVYETRENGESGRQYQELVYKPTDEEIERYERYAHIVNTYSKAGNMNLQARQEELLIGPDLLALSGRVDPSRSRSGPRQVREF